MLRSRWTGMALAGVIASAGAYADVAMVGATWTSLPIGGGGQTRDLAVHPQNSDILFAASDTGGIYKSVDGGLSWTLSNDGMTAAVPNMEILSSSTVAVDPARPDILYTCLGNIVRPGWMFKSVDGGTSWSLLTDRFRFDVTASFPRGQRAPRRCVTIDPHNPDTLYVLTYAEGIYRSRDGGQTFEHLGLDGVYVSSMAVHPTDPNTLFVGIWSDGILQGGVQRSTDGGVTWTTALSGVDVKDIAVSPQRPTEVYATSYWNGVAKSVDGGVTWKPTNGQPGADLPLGEGPPLYNPNDFEDIPRELVYGDIAIDPTNADVVYVTARGDGTVYKTIDAGASWSQIGLPEMTGPLVVTIDPRQSQNVYVTDSFGVWRSRDGGGSWELGVSGLENTVIETVVFDPEVPGRYYVGAFDLTLLITDDGGSTFTQIESIRDVAPRWRINAGLAIAIDTRTSPTTIYLGSGLWQASLNGGGIYKSTDGGATWITAHAGLPTNRIREVAIDPSSPDTLFTAVEESGVARSGDGGQTWQSLDNGIHFPEAMFKRGFKWHPEIVIDPSNGSNVYFIADVRAAGGTVDSLGTVYRSDDRGRRWLPANTGAEDRFPTTLSIDPVDPQRLYLGTERSGVFVTDDGARSWRRVGPVDFNVRSISVDPTDNEIVYAGGVGYLFRSTDRGESWEQIPGPPGLNLIRDVAIDPHQPTTLVVATGGQGLFRVELP